MDDDEAFTYAALRRIERQENTSPRLVKLEGRFWEQLGEHLAALRRAFQDQQEEDPTARRTVVLADELRNTQRLAESIWSLREKKVAQAALASIRRREGPGESPENVTAEERALFERVLQVFKGTRDEAGITDPFSRRKAQRAAEAAQTAAAAAQGGPPADSSMGGTSTATSPGAVRTGQGPSPPEPAPPTAAAAAARPPASSEIPEGTPHAQPADPVTRSSTAGGQEAVQQAGRGAGASAAQEAGGQAQQEAQDEGRGGVGASGELEMELWLVQALGDVPKFAGPDLNDYQLAKGEIGNLPRNAAELLQKKGKVRILPGA